MIEVSNTTCFIVSIRTLHVMINKRQNQSTHFLSSLNKTTEISDLYSGSFRGGVWLAFFSLNPWKFIMALKCIAWPLLPSSSISYRVTIPSLVPSRLLNALNCFVPFWGYHHCTQQAAASRGVRCCRHQLQTSHFPDKVCDKIKWNKLQPKWKCCPARHLR